jgi:hypothetical protein
MIGFDGPPHDTPDWLFRGGCDIGVGREKRYCFSFGTYVRNRYVKLWRVKTMCEYYYI